MVEPGQHPAAECLANPPRVLHHHDDVAAAGRLAARDLPRSDQEALWKRAATLARFRLRRFPGTVLVQAPGFGEVSTGNGGDTVRLVGAPGELVYFLAGRQRATRVQVVGPAPLADRLRTAALKM